MINWGDKIAISVAGGKGGIGKSCFAANLGVALSQLGKRVVLVDIAIGGANLHTLMGVSYPKHTLNDYYDGSSMSLESILIDTPYNNIKLLSSADDTLPFMMPDHEMQQKFKNDIYNLNADVFIFDISAGTHGRALDFFSFTPIGIILIELIPTALENAFVFIKHLLLRSLLRLLYGDVETKQFIKQLIDPRNNKLLIEFDQILHRLEKSEPEKIKTFRKRLSDNNFQMCIVTNSVQNPELLPVTEKFAKLVKRYLGLNLKILGSLPYEQFMNNAITERVPFIVKYPESEYMNTMQSIAKNILAPNNL